MTTGDMISREINDGIKGGMSLASPLLRSGPYVAANLLLAIIILTWLHIKALLFVRRQLSAHPDNKPLWCAILSCIFFILLCTLPGDKRPTFAVLAAVNFWIVVAVAKIVEVYYDRLLRAQFTRGQVLDDVLHPWRSAA